MRHRTITKGVAKATITVAAFTASFSLSQSLDLLTDRCITLCISKFSRYVELCITCQENIHRMCVLIQILRSDLSIPNMLCQANGQALPEVIAYLSQEGTCFISMHMPTGAGFDGASRAVAETRFPRAWGHTASLLTAACPQVLASLCTVCMLRHTPGSALKYFKHVRIADVIIV